MEGIVELWKPVVGYEGLYEVSDQGRVRSLPGKRWNGRAWITKKGCLRSLPICKQGYPVVDLKHLGKRKTFKVHTLVLTAFVGPRPEGYECRHLNGNRTDARLCNLAWGTPSQNTEDKRRHQTLCQGENHAAAKLNELAVKEIRKSNEKSNDLARKFGISQSLVSMIKSRKRWAHLQ
jgi:hypothetical protein